MTKRTWILIGFLVAKMLLQYLLINPHYDLQRDEYLHLDQANHVAWGFVSIPPFSSWVAYIIKLLGNGIFWVKFFPALFGVLTMVVVWKTIEALKGNLFALILGATCVLLSSLLRINFLFQPNSMDVLCWTMCYFVLIQYIITQQSKWLYIGGLAFAIGFLNKYNIAFLAIGLLPAILLSQQRTIFVKRAFYVAMAICLLLITPNILWQYHNGFPVFHHLQELAATQLVHVSRTNFLKEQLYFFIGSLPVIAAALYALLLYQPFKKFRLFFGNLIFTLLVFTYFKAKGYYAIGLYPIYIAFGAVFLGHQLATGWRKYLRPILIAIPVAVYVLLFNIVFSVKDPDYFVQHQERYRKLGLLRWEDGENHALPQDFADMLGWKELAQKVGAAYEQLPNKKHALILCDNYGQAGAINYYTTNKNIQAHSFNADYIDWFNLSDTIDAVISVKESKNTTSALEKGTLLFNSSAVADSITNPFAREYGTSILVFTHPKIDIQQMLRAELVKKKSNH